MWQVSFRNVSWICISLGYLPRSLSSWRTTHTSPSHSKPRRSPGHTAKGQATGRREGGSQVGGLAQMWQRKKRAACEEEEGKKDTCADLPFCLKKLSSKSRSFFRILFFSSLISWRCSKSSGLRGAEKVQENWVKSELLEILWLCNEMGVVENGKSI